MNSFLFGRYFGLLLAVLLGSSSAAEKYCGFINRAIDKQDVFLDQRVILYNSEWPSQFITVKDPLFADRIKKIVYYTSNDKNLAKKHSDYQINFSWYYGDSEDSYYLCINSKKHRASRGSHVERQYIDNVFETLSIRMNQTLLDLEAIQREVLMNRIGNQVLCDDGSDIFDVLEVGNCLAQNVKCFTGDAFEVAHILNGQARQPAIDFTHGKYIDSISVAKDKINLSVGNSNEPGLEDLPLTRCRPKRVKPILW